MSAVAIKDVDFDRLSDKLRERGLNMRQASLQMGKSAAYLGGMKRLGHLANTTLILLDAMWNIKYKDIEPSAAEEQIVPEAVEETENVTMSKGELRYIITEAVKDAFTWYANL